MIRSAAATTARAVASCRATGRTTASAVTVPLRGLSTTSYGDKKPLNYTVIPKDDFGRYKEYSVIFTNRALNLMSEPFQKVMRDLSDLLCTTYNAEKVAIIPGYVCERKEVQK
jgi:hypothetical protein